VAGARGGRGARGRGDRRDGRKHRLLLSLGQRLAATAGTWAWRAAQDVAAGTVRSPGAAALQGLAARPSVLVAGLLAGSLVYLSGLIVLRHLMLVPRQAVYARR
jgi:hypothetical protein